MAVAEADGARSGPAPAGTVFQYRSRGYAVVRSLIDPAVARFLAQYLTVLGRTGRLTPDSQVPGSASTYGDAAFDTLLWQLMPECGRLIGHELLPTYSFARLYGAGHALEPHTDRPSCEHSVSVHLDGEGPSAWPLELRDLAGQDVASDLDPGDAVLYQGCALEHWRRPHAGTWYAQVFLHYVAANGPHADCALDGRRSLATTQRPRADPGRRPSLIGREY